MAQPTPRQPVPFDDIVDGYVCALKKLAESQKTPGIEHKHQRTKGEVWYSDTV
jgi:hypothetical protein